MTHSKPKFDTGVDAAAPFNTLYHSHEHLVAGLAGLSELPALVDEAARARRLAAAAIDQFGAQMGQHHEDEERDLFPAVIRSAEPGEERERVEFLVGQLAEEHRSLEWLWKLLEPSVRGAAKGRCDAIDPALVERLVRAYSAHAAFEECNFLPLAQAILERNPDHVGALGVALHLRRVPPVSGHI